jgi:hypothetical protein
VTIHRKQRKQRINITLEYTTLEWLEKGKSSFVENLIREKAHLPSLVAGKSISDELLKTSEIDSKNT